MNDVQKEWPKGYIGNEKLFEGEKFNTRDLEQRGGVFPSGADLEFDLDQRFYPIFEAKRKGAPVKKGQKKLYEGRMKMARVAATVDKTYLSVCFHFEHETPEGEDIEIRTQPLIKYIDSITCVWKTPKKPVTVGEALEVYKQKYYKLLGKTEEEYEKYYYAVNYGQGQFNYWAKQKYDEYRKRVSSWVK